MKPRVLVVDGHSAIFRSEKLSALHAQRSLSARDRLIQLLTRYADVTDAHVVIVFDGRGAQMSQEHNPSGVQVFYSKQGQTADAIVERLVAKYADSHDMRVATDDYLERQTVASFGGSWMSTTQLFSEIQEADQNLKRKIEQLRRR